MCLRRLPLEEGELYLRWFTIRHCCLRHPRVQHCHRLRDLHGDQLAADGFPSIMDTLKESTVVDVAKFAFSQAQCHAITKPVEQLKGIGLLEISRLAL